MIGSKPANGRRRDGSHLRCSGLGRQARVVLGPEAAGTALEDVAVVEKPIEHGGDGCRVAEEFSPSGNVIDDYPSSTVGATVVLQHTFASTEAGEVHVSVHPYQSARYFTIYSTPLIFWTQPYTLTVTGP